MSENIVDPLATSEAPASQISSPETKTVKNVYVDSEFSSMLASQERDGRVPAALFTDIDNSFFRQDRKEASKQLFDDLQREGYPVVAVTGRSLDATERRIQIGDFPQFPIIAAAVGTEIYVLHDKNGQKVYEKDEVYERMLSEKGYNRPELDKIGQQMAEDLSGRNPAYPNPHPEWQFDFQKPLEELAYREGKAAVRTPFKISFYAFANSESSLSALRVEAEKRFPGKKIVICEEFGYNDSMQTGDTNKKYCIDILPTTKAGAVDYISEETGVVIKVIAGDSGNDSEMLTGTGDVSIIVGGSRPELISVVDNAVSETEDGRHFQRVTDASGKPIKLYYRERGTGLGPESITRAIRYLKLAQKLHARDSK